MPRYATAKGPKIKLAKEHELADFIEEKILGDGPFWRGRKERISRFCWF